MLLAQQKQKENIAEYIIYMYQMEDIVRAFQFDLDKLVQFIIHPAVNNDQELADNKKWFEDLIHQMKAQRLEQQGHVADIQDIVIELSYLHNTLLTVYNDEKYKTLHEQGSVTIEEFKAKSNLKDKNNIEIMLHAMYMKLLMRLKKQDLR
jgi:hypothetical protein